MTAGERRRIAEVAAAIILSVSTFVSSWAGYQANLWDRFQVADMMIFTHWLDAHARSDRALEDYYRRQFRPEFAAAVDSWLRQHPGRNPDKARSPFVMPDYHSKAMAEAVAAARRADAQFAAGQKANDISDAFENGVVFLALAMFLCGITQTFETSGARISLLTIGAIACLFGIARISYLPAFFMRWS